jgi:hypothetical protein
MKGDFFTKRKEVNCASAHQGNADPLTVRQNHPKSSLTGDYMRMQVKLKGTQCGSLRFPGESNGSRFPSVSRGVWGRVQGYDSIRRRWMSEERGHDTRTPREHGAIVGSPAWDEGLPEREGTGDAGEDNERKETDEGRLGLPAQNNGHIREMSKQRGRS